MRVKCGTVLAACLACLCASTRAQSNYTVTDLGPGIGADLNNKGQAVLYFGGTVPAGPSYFWDGAQFAYLPMSSLPPGYFNSVVMAENDSGQLAGWVHLGNNVEEPEGTAEAAFWPEGAGKPPILIGKASEVGVPTRVNGAGNVLLNRYRNVALSQPSLWNIATGFTPLPTLGGVTDANAINDGNLVAGSSHTPDGLIHAVMWKDGQIHQLDSGTWPVGAAYAVANDGEIAGVLASQNGSQRVMALWSPTGVLQTFSFPGGWGTVFGVNSAHQVLGQLSAGIFLFENGSFSLLKDLVPAGTPVFPEDVNPDINEMGQILLTGQRSNETFANYTGSVLLTPITPTSPIARALSIAGGLRSASASDLGSLGVQAPAGIGLSDAVRLARQAAGLE